MKVDACGRFGWIGCLFKLFLAVSEMPFPKPGNPKMSFSYPENCSTLELNLLYCCNSKGAA
jgi:hypothetical protein